MAAARRGRCWQHQARHRCMNGHAPWYLSQKRRILCAWRRRRWCCARAGEIELVNSIGAAAAPSARGIGRKRRTRLRIIKARRRGRRQRWRQSSRLYLTHATLSASAAASTCWFGVAKTGITAWLVPLHYAFDGEQTASRQMKHRRDERKRLFGVGDNGDRRRRHRAAKITERMAWRRRQAHASAARRKRHGGDMLCGRGTSERR